MLTFQLLSLRKIIKTTSVFRVYTKFETYPQLAAELILCGQDIFLVSFDLQQLPENLRHVFVME
jgi:hypothetical protein